MKKSFKCADCYRPPSWQMPWQMFRLHLCKKCYQRAWEEWHGGAPGTRRLTCPDCSISRNDK